MIYALEPEQSTAYVLKWSQAGRGLMSLENQGLPLPPSGPDD